MVVGALAWLGSLFAPFFGIAGEMAGEKAAGPGSLMIGMLDALYMLSPEELAARCRISGV